MEPTRILLLLALLVMAPLVQANDLVFLDVEKSPGYSLEQIAFEDTGFIAVDFDFAERPNFEFAALKVHIQKEIDYSESRLLAPQKLAYQFPDSNPQYDSSNQFDSLHIKRLCRNEALAITLPTVAIM